MKNFTHTWVRQGVPQVWLSAAAICACLLMTLGLIGLIGAKGLAHFMPRPVVEFNYPGPDGASQRLAGEFTAHEQVPRARLKAAEGVTIPSGVEEVKRSLLKAGNREHVPEEFIWVVDAAIEGLERPRDIAVIERREWGNLYGYISAYAPTQESSFIPVNNLDSVRAELDETEVLRNQIDHVERHSLRSINAALEALRLERRRLELKGRLNAAADARLGQEKAALLQKFGRLEARLGELYTELRRPRLSVTLSDRRAVEVPLAQVVRFWQPNALGPMDKLALYCTRLWEFVSAKPREANTEGGVFPAIFGTVLLVLIMSIVVTPFGVITAVFLHEYAGSGIITRLVRTSVNNLAGVPSVVYGVFGLGFFVYFVGGHLDQLLFPHALPSPTLGTPGLFWAALTLALLTVPVVVVATEEGLTRVPQAMREGSLALGATHAETLYRIVLPAALPAILTGLILAVARAAGEVAPLMLVGVVKLAPALPVDGVFPYLHLERKFMHLGFHIYDVGFQSPNAESARPLLYATAFLLVVLIVVLNLTAIRLRNRLREKYGVRSE